MELTGYQKEPPDLNAVFAALADPTRRQILLRLADGQATVREIAAPFDISQPAISKHLRVLENAGLIARDTHRQTRPARLNAAPMKDAIDWLQDFRAHWGDRLDHLDQLLHELQTKDSP